MTKCCDMHAGMMRNLITIERVARTTDGMGGFTEVWSEDPVGGVYAYMRGVSGSALWAAMRVTPSNRFKAVIRFRDDGSGGPYYATSDRVIANGRTYAIESVVDMEQRREWIELNLTEGAAP